MRPECFNCDKELKPDLKAIDPKTKKWNGLTFKCKCMPETVRVYIKKDK